MKPSSFRALGLFLGAAISTHAAAPFFDPSMPVHGSPVDGGASGVIARGLLVQAAEAEWLVFDQDLLRPALWVHADQGKPPVSLIMMSQASWEKPTQKGGVKQPAPAAGSLALVPPLPGVGSNPEDLLKDPRPVHGNDPGRGGLEASGRRFSGYHVAGKTGVLVYENQGTKVSEWYEADRRSLQRHLAVAAGDEILFLVAAGDFKIASSREAASEKLQVSSNHPGLTLESRDGKLFARLAASRQERRVTLIYGVEKVSAAAKTPAVPTANPAHWKQSIETRIRESEKSGPGWTMDRIGLPENSAFKRRVRPADIVFLSPEKAAVITFEGDVWRLDLAGERVRWTRIAAGLCEPLSIEQVGGVLQVFTRNGIVRLRDTNADGETDFYENYSSLIHHTAGTRGYPLDMEVDESGRTWCSIGGIVTNEKSLTNLQPPNPHSGSIMMISADGKQLEIVGAHAREPFFARDPESGRIVMSEQQGHWVPSSGIFPVEPGSSFGFGQENAKGLTPPAVWIPHDQDSSSSSPMWVRGSAFKSWEGGVLDLSYGTGRLFLARPAGAWPAKEGAVIPLGIETGLPILHARTHPGDGSLWLAGFRIYDSRAPELEGIGRLRPSGDAFRVPVDAKLVKEGAILCFDAPLDGSTVTPDAVQAKEWQYRRSSGYGSPRLKRDGKDGVDPVASGGTFLSKDGKSVFIHIPGMKPTMQLEISHRFAVKGSKPEARSVFFTVSAPAPAMWNELGFEVPELDPSIAVVHGGGAADAVPTAEAGMDLATRYGCIACHSTDGKLEGHSGPSWKGLHGSQRSFTDGTSRMGDDAYIIESMTEPNKVIVKGYALGMGSYSGVLSEAEMQSIVLFIRSLK
ncbi:c-type cytochrome [Luteolibacter luteus]|uniref:Cytochrome c n=1 Tax=Luteolibacter luteus TaxID=2728835 RepID=A0A858RP40_9BACT|nr:cytochrome c [Luteolibacter luteus]QJE98381.1 cytochrome c [Luteolibacter luteus]